MGEAVGEGARGRDSILGSGSCTGWVGADDGGGGRKREGRRSYWRRVGE